LSPLMILSFSLKEFHAWGPATAPASYFVELNIKVKQEIGYQSSQVQTRRHVLPYSAHGSYRYKL
jgi:hypothetical protein